MIDNQDVAILTKLNDLAERHGLRACDFLATVRLDSKSQSSILNFDGPTGDGQRDERFDKMLNDLGVNKDGDLIGDSATIIEAVDRALEVAPRPRWRG
jgi:hypothetical protein